MADQSYAIDPAQPVQQQGERGPATINVVPAQQVGQIGGQAYDASFDKTGQAMLKLGGDILAPLVKEESQRQFLQGVTQAAQGEAITDIVRDRPWYSEIFGPSSAVLGARAYTTSMKIAQWGAQMENDMPRLAEATPENFLAQAQEGMKQFLTGDTQTDIGIQTAFAEQLAPLAKRHAKEHYIVQQRAAVDAQGKDWISQSDSLQKTLAAAARPDGGVDPKDAAAAKAQMLGHLSPFADQSNDSYNASMANFLYSAAQKGNFHVIRTFKDAGIWDKLPLDTQQKLDGQLATLGRKALDVAMPGYAMELAMITRDTLQDPRKAPARFDAFNARVAKETGVTEAEMIPKGSYDNLVGHILTSQAAALAAGKSAENDAGQIATARTLASTPGMLDSMVAMGTLKEVNRERAVAGLWAESQDPKQRAAIINSSAKTYDVVKSQMNLSIQSEEYSSAVGQTAATFAAMATDEQRGGYFTVKQQGELSRFNSFVAAGDNAKDAWVKAKRIVPIAQENQLADTEKNEVRSLIRKKVESANESWYGRNSVTDSALRTIETLTNKAYRELRGPNGTEVAVGRALGQAQANGLEVIGKHAVIGNPGQKPLAEMLLTGKDNAGPIATAEAFDEVMQENATAQGIKLDDYYVIRTGDVNGQARFIVEASALDGDKVKTARWYINSDQLRSRLGKKHVDTSNKIDMLGRAFLQGNADRSAFPTE